MIKITPRRIMALLALVAGVAGLTQLGHRPDDVELGLVAPRVQRTPASAPADGAVPVPALAEPLPARGPVMVVPQGAVLSIGSEGYGPHIERAEAGWDAGAAWEAVRWLRLCATNEQRRSSFEKVREQGVSPEMMTQLMIEADAEARRCQTVTPQHRAMLAELASRAMRAGMPEAASAYAGAVFADDLAPAERQAVAAAMRRDARAGDPQSLLGATLSHEAWGISDAERMTFLSAYGEIAGPNGKAVVRNLIEQRAVRFKVPPTPEQWAAAEAAAQQIVAQSRAQR